jgi:hypothetical protein
MQHARTTHWGVRSNSAPSNVKAIGVQSRVPTRSRAISQQKLFLSLVERRDIASLRSLTEPAMARSSSALLPAVMPRLRRSSRQEGVRPAVADYDEVNRLESKFARTHVSRADAYTKDYDRAVADYTKCIGLADTKRPRCSLSP